MSHQTGATFATEWFQTTELMKAFKQPRPAQSIYKEVPTFDTGGKEEAARASRVNLWKTERTARVERRLPFKCQYRGMAQNKKPKKENVENSAFGGAMREEALRAEEQRTEERWEGWNEWKGQGELGGIRERGTSQRPYMLRMDTRL